MVAKSFSAGLTQEGIGLLGVSSGDVACRTVVHAELGE
jgi:hypothetical protein